MHGTFQDTLQTIKRMAPKVLGVLSGTAARIPREEADFSAVVDDRDYTEKQHLATFFTLVDNALQQTESILNDLERRKDLRGAMYPAEVELDSEFEDFETSIAEYQSIQVSLQQLAVLHRYMRLSLDERERLISAYLAGETNKVLVRTFPHTVARFETLESIAAQYGIADWRQLAEFNDILATDLKAGDILHVPVSLTPTDAAQLIGTLPLFGTLAGESSFGRDLPNELQEEDIDTQDGQTQVDLRVLAPVDTLGQGLQNIVTTSPGEHPTNRAFGFSGVVNDAVPSDVREAWVRARAEEALLQDPRVQAVRVESISSEGQSVSLEITVFPKASNPVRIER